MIISELGKFPNVIHDFVVHYPWQETFDASVNKTPAVCVDDDDDDDNRDDDDRVLKTTKLIACLRLIDKTLHMYNVLVKRYHMRMCFHF